jgi:L-amino acid N-acyltransferase YncA
LRRRPGGPGTARTWRATGWWPSRRATSSVGRRSRAYRNAASTTAWRRSVYVAERARGKGVGTALLAELVAGADDNGIWTVQAGVFPENVASLALHRQCGFRVVGVRERIGRLNGHWRDAVLLERRRREN